MLLLRISSLFININIVDVYRFLKAFKRMRTISSLHIETKKSNYHKKYKDLKLIKNNNKRLQLSTACKNMENVCLITFTFINYCLEDKDMSNALPIRLLFIYSHLYSLLSLLPSSHSTTMPPLATCKSGLR